MAFLSGVSCCQLARKIPSGMVSGSQIVPIENGDPNVSPFTSDELGWYIKGRECTSCVIYQVFKKYETVTIRAI